MLCQYVLMLKLYVIVVLTQSFQGSWGWGGAGSEDKKSDVVTGLSCSMVRVTV